MEIIGEDTPLGGERKSDAGLLEAFEEWKRASRIAENLPDAMEEDARKPYWDAVVDAESKMMASAETPLGVEVKLLLSFAVISETPDCYDAVLSGEDLNPQGEVLSDFRFLMFWSAIQDLHRMNGDAL